MTPQQELVLDGELSLDLNIDGEASLNIQQDGDASGVIKIEPVLEPITVSKNGTFYPGDGTNGFSQVTVDADIEEDYEWRKPDDWPDLESVELPGSWDENTVYFLFDKKCGIDDVQLYLDGKPYMIYKGTIADGEFIGNLVYEGRVQKYRDTLTEEYTVYKFVGKSDALKFHVDTSVDRSYSWCLQGCVWIYGEIPMLNEFGGSPSSSILTPYMRRINFTHVKRMYPTFPPNLSSDIKGYDVSISYVCGYEEPNDWANLPMNRTGNGPITPPIKQKSEYVVKHINFQNSYNNAAVTGRNVVLLEPSGNWKKCQYQYNILIERFVIRGGTLKSVSFAYMFYWCINLRECDLSGLDFSETTDSGNAFYRCINLETLILNSTWKMNLDLSFCAKLSRESILGIFNVLPTISETRKITLNGYAKFNAKLTPEEIAIATDKGWTVA